MIHKVAWRLRDDIDVMRDEVMKCVVMQWSIRSTTWRVAKFWCNRNTRDMTRVKLWDHGSCLWSHDDEMWNITCKVYDNLKLEDACVMMCCWQDEVMKWWDAGIVDRWQRWVAKFWCNRNTRDMTRIKLYDHGSCWRSHDDEMWNIVYKVYDNIKL